MKVFKEVIEREVERRRQELTAMSDWLKRNPETGYREYIASWLLTSYLEREGFHVERCVAGLETAFRATQKGMGERPVVALMAEYDALPGIGHGCGHNIIAISTVGAAMALKELMPELGGTLVVVGTPAEEEPKLPSSQSPPHLWGGKVIMVNNGVFDNVDFAMMIHPSGSGFSYMKRTSSVASTGLQITFIREPESKKAVTEAVEKLSDWIDGFNQDSTDVACAKLEGTEDTEDWTEVIVSFRASNVSHVEDLANKALKKAERISNKMGISIHHRYFMETYADMIWNTPMVEASMRNLTQAGEVPLLELDRPNLGDESNVSHIVPTICTWVRTTEEPIREHTEEFANSTVTPLGHEAILKGAKTLAMTAIDLFTDRRLVQDAISDFVEVSRERALEIANRNHVSIE
jgi:metal-dependent amidase/aminoacylase/carboxypeptidase family protein